MELRSFNVVKVWRSVVKCVIGEDLGVDKDALELHRKDIESMVDQIAMYKDGNCLLLECNKRIDGEVWTPYLQIVEMLIRMGRKIGALSYDGSLGRFTLVHRVFNFRIDRNKATNGFCSTFSYLGKEYYADLSYVLDKAECMIFNSDNGETTSWIEEYVDYPSSVSEKALAKCIVEFINKISYGKKIE